MEGALSSLMKSNQDLSKSTVISSTVSQRSLSKQTEVTHASLLVDCMPFLVFPKNEIRFYFLVLKSYGVPNSESYLQKVIQTYPKFIPILNTRIPTYLVSIISNDPVTREIASIFGNKQVRDCFQSLRYWSTYNLGSTEFDNFFDQTKVGEG